MEPIYPSILACVRKFATEFADVTNENYLFTNVLASNLQMWVVYDTDDPNKALLVLFTELKVNEALGTRFVELTATGGERVREALPLLKHVEDWAVAHGANEVRIVGRFGWIPVLLDHSYVKRAVVLTKKLELPQ